MRDRPATHRAEDRRAERHQVDVAVHDERETNRARTRRRLADLQVRLRNGGLVATERAKVIAEVDSIFETMKGWL